MKKSYLFLLLGIQLFASHLNAQVPIDPLFFGQNMWNSNVVGSNSYFSAATWTRVQEAGVRTMRWGGISINIVPTRPEKGIYLSVVNDMRSHNCEPMLQIPFFNTYGTYGSIAQQAEEAGEIVNFVNNIHQQKVVYWMIGNEPDLAPTNGYGLKPTSAADALIKADSVSKYIIAFAIAMKNADPNIKIIAPSTTFYTSDPFSPMRIMYGYLFSDPNNSSNVKNHSIAGAFKTKSGQTRYYVDIIDFHMYPADRASGHGALEDRDIIAHYPYAGADPWNKFSEALDDIRSLVVSANRPDMKISVSEFNSGHENNIANNGVIGANASEVDGLDPRSFIGGQMIIDLMGMGLEKGTPTGNYVQFMNMWATKEGGYNIKSDTTNRGFLNGNDGSPRPSFYMYKMMATGFKGFYYPSFYNNSSTRLVDNNYLIKAMASYKAGEQMAVIIMNQSASQSYDYEVHLNNSTGFSTTGLKINFNMPVASNGIYNSSVVDGVKITPETTIMILFDCNGKPIKRYTYTRQNADANYDPTLNANITNITFYGGTPTTFTASLSSNNVCKSSAPNGILTASPSGAGYSYIWSTGASGSSNTLPGLNPGYYSVTVTGPGPGCNTSSAGTFINTKTSIANAGVDFNSCAGNSVQIGGLQQPSTTYFWSSIPSGFSSSSSNPTVSPTVTTSYIVTANSSSTGCSTKDTVNVTIPPDATDLYIQDRADDNGTEPDPHAPWDLYAGDDLWIRNQPASKTQSSPKHFAFEGVHQNPDWSTNTSYMPYVYVRVRNRGCQTVSGKVHVYFTRGALMNDIWPSGWTEIGTGQTIALAENEVGVIEQFWDLVQTNVPQPTGSGENYCMLARFVCDNPPNDDPMANEQTSTDAGWNAQRNNNIVQKNVSLVDLDQLHQMIHHVWVVNTAAIPIKTSLEFKSITASGSYLDYGSIKVDLGQELYERWVAGGQQGSGIEKVKTTHMSESGILHNHSPNHNSSLESSSPYEIKITSSNAKLENILLDPHQDEKIAFDFRYSATPDNYTQNDFSFYAYEFYTLNGVQQGGSMKYEINAPKCPVPDAGPDMTIGSNCKTTLTASPIIPGVSYVWRSDRTGAIVDTGSVIEVSPLVTTTYELEMSSPNGCIDYDNVTVTVNTAQACLPGCGRPDYNNQSLANNTEINGSEIVISGTLKVPNNITLKIINSKLNFGEGAKIEVMNGGKLVIINSQLGVCDITKKWQGIIVKGNNHDNEQLMVSGSTITDATTPISMDKVTNASIIGNNFANGTTAITMDQSKNFEIVKNQFYTYDIGIQVNNSLTDVKSLISQNYFYKIRSAVVLEKGNNTLLDLKCNLFDSYTDYAIYSNNTTLKDQGTLTEGAGNVFVSNSTKVNDKLRHNGNAMKYYYDPSTPVTLVTGNGLSAQAKASISDGACMSVSNFRSTNQEEPEITNGGSINESAKSNVLYSIPNPASDKATIIYSLPENTLTAEIRITNLLGELVTKYQVAPGSSSVEVNCSEFKNGIYFYSLITDNNLVNTKKMVITK